MNAALVALYALGLDLTDFADMKRCLLVGIRDSNRELLESFK